MYHTIWSMKAQLAVIHDITYRGLHGDSIPFGIVIFNPTTNAPFGIVFVPDRVVKLDTRKRSVSPYTGALLQNPILRSLDFMKPRKFMGNYTSIIRSLIALRNFFAVESKGSFL